MDAWALERQEEYDTANGVIHKTPMSKAKMILMDSKKKTTVANQEVGISLDEASIEDDQELVLLEGGLNWDNGKSLRRERKKMCSKKVYPRVDGSIKKLPPWIKSVQEEVVRSIHTPQEENKDIVGRAF